KDIAKFVSFEGAANTPQLTIRLNRGSTCSATAQCSNADVCGADGVCCENTCVGTCRSCLASQSGSSNGTCAFIPNRSDPGNECQHTCNGAGACGTGCNTTADCGSGFYCTGNTCTAKKAVGEVCGGNVECLNDQCVDNRCCGSASCSTCQACRADWT